MPRLNGIVIPLPTPFTDSGEVDHDGIRELTRFYLNAGVHGLFALGTFGQGPALSPDERKEIARVVLETVGGRIPTTIHVGCADTPTTIALAKDAVEKGAPAVAVVPPPTILNIRMTRSLPIIRRSMKLSAIPFLFTTTPSTAVIV